MLTEEAKKEYIKSPYHCPYCGSKDIESGNIDWNEPLGLTVSCDSCGKMWIEILKVADIEEIEEEVEGIEELE